MFPDLPQTVKVYLLDIRLFQGLEKVEQLFKSVLDEGKIISFQRIDNADLIKPHLFLQLTKRFLRYHDLENLHGVRNIPIRNLIDKICSLLRLERIHKHRTSFLFYPHFNLLKQLLHPLRASLFNKGFVYALDFRNEVFSGFFGFELGENKGNISDSRLDIRDHFQ